MGHSESSAMDIHVLRKRKWVVAPMDYLFVLSRRKWVVVQLLLLGPLIALVFTLHQAPEYEATAGVLLHLDHGHSLAPRTSAAPSEDPARVVKNEARRAASLPVAEGVVRATRPAFTSPGNLLDHSTVSTNEGSDLLTIAVRHTERVSALVVANAYASQVALYLQNAPTMVHSQAPARAIPVARRVAEVQPRPVHNAVLGIGIGLLFGLAAAFLCEALDGRIRSRDEVAELLGLPLLGQIRESPRLRSQSVAMLESPNSPQAESFRILRVALDTLHSDIGARTLMITSAIDGEGKSSTAANLAVAYARSGLRVILADLDLRAPSLDRLFGLEGRAGVNDVAIGHLPLDAALAEVPVMSSSSSSNGDASYRGSLHVLPAAPVPPELREMVLVQWTAELLPQLTSKAEIVLVDAPPIVPVTEAQALVSYVDRLLVVIGWSFARRRTLKDLRCALVASGARPVGFVLVAGAGEMTEAYSGPEPCTPFSTSMRPTTAKVISESSSASGPRTKTRWS
jgi:polysaccharide biosynthesis transport protein